MDFLAIIGGVPDASKMAFSERFRAIFDRFRTVSARFARFSHRFFLFFCVVAPQRDRGAVTAPLRRRRGGAA